MGLCARRIRSGGGFFSPQRRRDTEVFFTTKGTKGTKGTKVGGQGELGKADEGQDSNDIHHWEYFNIL